MTHEEWVKKQFDPERTKSNYRNVLIHSSFVETIIRKAAGGVHFDCAIKTLRTDSNYKDEPWKEIDNLRDKRNDIVHEILKNKTFKTENDIKKVVKEMHALLKQIYSRSSLVNTHFEDFSINPKTKF